MYNATKVMVRKNAKENKGLPVSERHFGVILEDIDSKLDFIVEGRFALDKKMDNNHQEFGEFRDEMNYKIEAVFDELHLIRGDLVKKVDRNEFTALEKRVTVLEK